jgi:hypothetical protein
MRRVTQLIHDDPRAQGLVQQWLWQALTCLLWLALLSVLLPSAWSMLLALGQWAIDLQWRHWLGSLAVIGLLLLRSRKARRHSVSAVLQAKQARYMAQQQLRSPGNSRVLLATHNHSGQLIALRAIEPEVEVPAAKMKVVIRYVLAYLRKIMRPLLRAVRVAPRGLQTCGRRDSIYYICAPP